MTVAPSSVLAIFLCLLISGGCGGGKKGGAAAQSAWTMPGIVRQATRPASVAQCVEVDGAWMVPYEETIPGTAVRFTMIPVPGGSFRMGSPKDEHGRHDTEGPPFTVEMPPFWIGRCEVTWGEYRTFMAATAIFRAKHGDDPPSTPAEVGVDAVTAPSMLYDPDAVYASVAADRPATGMSQYAARQYTKWISKLTTRFYRIPSECEWEYACRAGSKTPWSSGADVGALQEVAWYVENAGDQTQPVGQKRANAWGLHDMHGNVAEWVMDQVTAQGYARQARLSVPVQMTEAIEWPKQLESRAVRGGAFYDEPTECRSAARRKSADEAWNDNDPSVPPSPHWLTASASCGLGFRVVRPFVSPAAAERERWWEADVESIREAVAFRTQLGCAASGLVDEEVVRELAAELHTMEAVTRRHADGKDSESPPTRP